MKARYIRRLMYYDAIKVIDFINKQDKRNYANITVGGVQVSAPDENVPIIEDYMKSINVGYEVGFEPPYKIHERIIEQLKEEDYGKSINNTK